MLADAQFLRAQAERCRWLARNSTDPAVVVTLNDMARGYDQQAAALQGDRGPP
jgi:hypothetical protein